MPETADHYDDDAFTYVAIVFMLMILLPATYYHFTSKNKQEAPKYPCNCPACQGKPAAPTTRQGTSRLAIGLALGYVILAFLVYSAAGSDEAQIAPFNPFDVLGVSEYATEKEIRRAHRRLSLKYHPDKNPDDPSAAEAFVELSRAHRTLTDPVAKENWIKYGNPDGRQGFSMAIALPSWLVARESTLIVLLGYMLLLGAIGGTAVWLWKGWREMSPIDIKYDTMRVYYYFVGEDVRAPKKLLDVLAASDEYKTMPIRSTDGEEAAKLEGLMRQVHPDYAPCKTGVYRRELLRFNAVPKCTMLFHAHLNRLHHAMSEELRGDLNTLLLDVQRLVKGMVSTLVEGRGLPSKHLTPALAAVRTGQCLVQACWPNQELLQLPGIDLAWVKDMCRPKWKNPKGTLRGFLEASPTAKKELLMGSDALRARKNTYFMSQEDFDRVAQVAGSMPSNISMTASAFVQDTDAHIISPGCTVVVSVRVRRVPRPAGGALAAIPNARRQLENMLQGKDWADVDANEAEEETQSIEAIQAAAIKAARERRFGSAQESIVPTPVHCPYIPDLKVEQFILFLGDPAGAAAGGQLWGVKRLEVAPLVFADMPGEPTEVRFTMMAPKKVGRHTMQLYLRSDSYLGLDVKIPVVMNVEAIKDQKPIAVDRFSSEEEEEEAAAAAAAATNKGDDGVPVDEDDVFAD